MGAESGRHPENRFLAVFPCFLVDDVVAAAAFYRDRLGFTFDRFWGEPPRFVLVRRGGVQILLSRPGSGQDSAARRNRQSGGGDLSAVYVQVEDADALCAEFRARGVPIVRGPENATYGMREFVIEDCNGYILCFGHSVRPVR
jgi:catechol 2,3-dioxygenase-like lactoylglutathione lyase family enzyme